MWKFGKLRALFGKLSLNNAHYSPYQEPRTDTLYTNHIKPVGVIIFITRHQSCFEPVDGQSVDTQYNSAYLQYLLTLMFVKFYTNHFHRYRIIRTDLIVLFCSVLFLSNVYVVVLYFLSRWSSHEPRSFETET